MSVLSVRNLDTLDAVLGYLTDFKTPLENIVTREGRDGQMVHYITHQYVTQVLNTISRFNWSNKVIKDYVEWDSGEVAVLCRLKVNLPDNVSITHDGWGGSTIARYSGGERKGEIIRRALTDAYNAASSLALTKAASRLGIGLDLSTGITSETLNRFNADGNNLFKKNWNDVRPVCVRAAVCGRTKGGEPIESSRDLREIEGRMLCKVFEEWSRAMAQTNYRINYGNEAIIDLAKTLRPTAQARIVRKTNNQP